MALSRRSFLSGRSLAEQEARSIFPPWTTQKRVLDQCTACGECIAKCPENILSKGRAGQPVVHFKGGACTFCGECAKACDEDVFDLSMLTPWALTIDISDECLLKKGITCQTCTDSCAASALGFNLRVRPVGAVTFNADLCTGCGACVGVCPVEAIHLKDAPRDALSTEQQLKGNVL